jgi:hypothetical protein
MKHNYPNHPLFRIAPLLYNWRGDVRHDEYVSSLIGRIRAGRHIEELFSSNSLLLDYSQRTSDPVDRQTPALKSRHKFTAETRAEYLALMDEIYNSPERRANRERNQAALAERRRVEDERAAAYLKRNEEFRRQEQEWKEARALALAQHDDHCIMNVDGAPWRIVGLDGDNLHLQSPTGQTATADLRMINWDAYHEIFAEWVHAQENAGSVKSTA